MKIERSIGVAKIENERTLTEDCFCFSLSGYLMSELSCYLTVGDPIEKRCKNELGLTFALFGVYRSLPAFITS